ncbi:hypothetical protein MASR1M45_05020 [Candidatus Kapaibacterium sp.]
MFDILFARTLIIVGGMLVITAITSRINKTFETSIEMLLTIFGTFAFLFAIVFFADIYPLNILLVSIFSALVGWQIGPTIEHFGERFKIKEFLKSRGVVLKKGQFITKELRKEFEQSFDIIKYQREWNNIVFQAIFATAISTLSAAGLVFLTNTDFSFLGGFLLISIIMLIIMGVLNILFFRSRIFSLVRAYIGAVIFTLYLIYDFDRLEKFAGDDSWNTAINIAVKIYLDVINLFLKLLEIISESK